MKQHIIYMSGAWILVIMGWVGIFVNGNDCTSIFAGAFILMVIGFAKERKQINSQIQALPKSEDRE